MAELSPLISFTAGDPAVADDVNQNFTDIRNHINGANIGTENIVTALLSRSGGPILNLTQLTENQIAFNVENSQSNTAVSIAQLASLAVGKATLKISETVAQTQGDAQLFLSLQSSSTIPALLVKHGAVDTFKLTRTTLDVSSAVTTTLGGPLVLSNLSVTGPINLSGNLTVTGKETINRTSTNQFLELANTTTSKSLTVTPQTSSFDLNINDIASAYNFKIDGSTKAVIDNNGINSTYINLAQSLAASGYYRLPGNQLIIQWGNVTVHDDQYISVTFPTPFISAVYSVVSCVVVNSAIVGPAAAASHVGSVSLSSFSCGVSASGGSPVSAYWIAIGK